MKKLFFLIAGVLILYILKPDLFPFKLDLKENLPIESPDVMVFTINDCKGHCRNSLNDLARRNVNYTEYPVDGNQENMKLWESYGRGAFPYVIVGDEKIIGYDKGRQAAALARYYGDTYLTNDEKKYYKNHFYEDDSPKVYMYGAAWCPICKKMRIAFENRGIDYVEIDVEKHHNRRHLEETIHIPGFPVIYVGYNRVPKADIRAVKDAISVARNRSL